jgi:hypothetical protein
MTTPSHETLREQLLDLAYGELSRRDAAALRRHLEGCADCRDELARMEGMRALMSALPDAPAPEGGERILLAAAREVADARRARRRLAWLWGAPVGAVAAIVVALVSYRVFTLAPRPDAEPVDGFAVAPQPPASAPLPSPSPASAPVAAAEAKARDEAPGAAGGGAAQPEARRELLAEKSVPAPQLGAAGNAAAGGAPEPGRRPRATAPENAGRGELALRRKGEEEAAPPKDEADALERDGDARAGQDRTSKVARADELPSWLDQARVDDAPPPPAAPKKAPSPAVARAEAQASGAVSPSEQAPSRAREESGASASKELAKPAARAPAAAPVVREDAIARHHRLELAGRLRVSTVTFANCAGESFREVAVDEVGRVVRQVRRGERGGTPYEAQLYYVEDGSLGAVRYEERGKVREARFDPAAGPAGVEGVPPSALEPRRAEDAGLGAPARCQGS